MMEDDSEVFTYLLLDDVGVAGNNQHGALSGKDRAILKWQGDMMGSQELYHMNSILLHLQEDNKSIRKEMGRIHEQNQMMLKLVNKN